MKSKVLADYLGYIYIPFNDLQGFRKPGFYRPLKTDSTYEETYRKTSNDYYLGRGLKDLNFQGDYNKLFEVAEKLEDEILSDYFGENFQEVVIEFVDIWHIYIKLRYDPPKFISKVRDGIPRKEQLFLSLIDAVEYINELKDGR